MNNKFCVYLKADTNESLAPDLPIFCADNRQLIVIYNGINENKSFIRKDMSRNTVKEKESLSQFLAKERDFLKTKFKNKEFLNISDISFNDESKSGAFFDDLLKSSQSIPQQRNELTLSPHFNIDQLCDKSINSNQNIENENQENRELCHQKKKIISPKLKLIDFSKSVKKTSPPLKSDQLYDKRFVKRSDKVITTKEKKYKRNKTNENCAEKVTTTSLQTLSKFHKTSSEKLLTKPKSEVISKINIPNIFELNKVN